MKKFGALLMAVLLVVGATPGSVKEFSQNGLQALA